MTPTPALLALVLLLTGSPALAEPAKLLREPDIAGDTLVFSYARDIWRVALEGGTATRLSSFQGQERNPHISPDGEWVAFTGEYDGNADIYVVSINGGEPRRLTFHPAADTAVGWRPDGSAVLFTSSRDNAPRNWGQLFTVSVNGGMPERLPMNRAQDGSFSDDGRQMVFRRSGLWDRGFRNYRGGQNQALRVINLEDLSERDLPWDNSLDLSPVWQGDWVYYLSNQSQVTNVFRVNVTGGEPEALTTHTEHDVMGFALDGDHIVYEHHGALVHQSIGGGATEIDIHIAADFPWNRPHWEDVSKSIESAGVSPSGKRALFVSRGDVFTVPAEHGDPRNLTDTSGVRETGATWSNSGRNIAWFSDASGEYRLVIADQFGAVQDEIELAETGFYQELAFSPDDRHLLFSDQAQRLWVADIEAGDARTFATQPVVNPDWSMMPAWSPDSRYIAYVKQDSTYFRSLYVYGVAEGETHRLTNGMADVRYPAWDADGGMLYVTASTDFGPAAPWLDLSTLAFTPSQDIYTILLNAEVTPPLSPRSDEEPLDPDADTDEDEEEDGDSESDDGVEVRLDLDGIVMRMLPLGVSGQIASLETGKAGELFYLKTVDGETALHRYASEDREAKKLADGVDRYAVSADGEQVLVQTGGAWKLFASGAPMGDDAKTLNVKLSKWVDNASEWQQMFREAWRFQRDYFYVTNLNGADWDQVFADYQPLVQHVRHAADMTYLLDNVGAETSVGHSFTYDGDLPDTPDSKVGLLGADIRATDAGFVFERLFLGERWYPDQQDDAPLANHSDEVLPGDMLKAINGRELKTGQNLFEALRGTRGRQTTLTIARRARDADIEVTVVPIDDESILRRNAWVEDNRRKVDAASDGKLAYVWVPDTGEGGYRNFNRYYYAQAQKQGIIVDERFNHGGFIANYIIDILRREPNGYFNNRWRPDLPMTSPGSGIWGPKVMLINEVSGSGGDMLPWLFRHYDVGPLVGKRTWGGLVGIWGVPALIDGGYITAPRSGFFTLEGEWEVENEGVAPDIEVEQWTAETSRGHDPQLDRAIEVALDALSDVEPLTPIPPADPVRVPQAD